MLISQDQSAVGLFDFQAEEHFAFQLFETGLDFEHLAFVKVDLVFEFVEVGDFDLTGLDVVFDLVQFVFDILNLIEYFVEVSLFNEILDFVDPKGKLSQRFFTTDLK